MPRDNNETSPSIILSRRKNAANPARLNMELALTTSDQINTGATSNNSPSGIAASEIATGTGGTGGRRNKVDPNDL